MLQVPPNEAYEHSELLLYKAMVIEESGNPNGALEVLDKEKVCALPVNHRAQVMGRSAGQLSLVWLPTS